jgi:hypothetical protein
MNAAAFGLPGQRHRLAPKHRVIGRRAAGDHENRSGHCLRGGIIGQADGFHARFKVFRAVSEWPIANIAAAAADPCGIAHTQFEPRLLALNVSEQAAQSEHQHQGEDHGQASCFHKARG